MFLPFFSVFCLFLANLFVGTAVLYSAKSSEAYRGYVNTCAVAAATNVRGTDY